MQCNVKFYTYLHLGIDSLFHFQKIYIQSYNLCNVDLMSLWRFNSYSLKLSTPVSTMCATFYFHFHINILLSKTKGILAIDEFILFLLSCQFLISRITVIYIQFVQGPESQNLPVPLMSTLSGYLHMFTNRFVIYPFLRIRLDTVTPTITSTLEAYVYFRGLLGFGDTIGLQTRLSHDVRQQIMKGPQSMSMVHWSGSRRFGHGFMLRKSTGHAAES